VVPKVTHVMSSLIQPGDIVSFQDDSITDAGRSREHIAGPNQQTAFGRGYAWIAVASLLTSRGDGVHPTAHGAALMAHHWLAAVNQA